MFYYGNEMLDKNTLECRVDTGKWRKQVGGLCGPTINSVIDFKKVALLLCPMFGLNFSDIYISQIKYDVPFLKCKYHQCIKPQQKADSWEFNTDRNINSNTVAFRLDGRT